MKKLTLRQLIFLALCCDLGLFTKKLVAPFTNLLTDSLHIPGGISTSFSLMFLVVAVVLVPKMGCGTVMGAVQSVLALAFGMVGSMGALSFIGYILPGVAMDCVLWLARRVRLPMADGMVAANLLAAVTASLTANLIVFHLSGVLLLLYLSVSACSGAVCGMLGARVQKF